MNYRSSEILASESIATAGTKTIDINLKDVISRISLQVKLTGTGTDPTAHPAKAVSKIEIVDGSNVVFSMKGVAAQALDFYDTSREPGNALAYANDVQAIAVFNLNFGRRLYDDKLALDPAKFNNLQLKISHNLALGGQAPDAATLSVRADVFDEKAPSLLGYLCSKEHYSVPDLSSDVNYIDLPTDFILRKMLIQGNADDKMPFEQFNQVRLSEEHDKKVVLEGYTSDFIKLFAMQWPVYHELLMGYALTTTNNFFVTPTYWPYYAVMSDDALGYTMTANFAGGQAQDIRGSTAGVFRGVLRGYCPHGAVPFPFGLQDDLSDWYDVTRLGSLRLKLTQGSSVSGSESIDIITQQLRTY